MGRRGGQSTCPSMNEALGSNPTPRKKGRRKGTGKRKKGEKGLEREERRREHLKSRTQSVNLRFSTT